MANRTSTSPLDDIAFRIGAALQCVHVGDLDAAKIHIEVARDIVGTARVERGLAELKHAPVIETRELGFDLSDARDGDLRA